MVPCFRKKVKAKPPGDATIRQETLLVVLI
jgi:hypothetical protein